MKPSQQANAASRWQSSDSLTRRYLLKGGALALTAIILPSRALAELFRSISAADSGFQSVAAGDNSARALAFYNTHTGEALKVVYFDKGEYVAGALKDIDYLFRDFRTNQIKPIDPRLLDLLHRIHSALDTSHPFNLISGYRSPATNAWLASRSKGVSHHSLHLEGRAADINVPGRDLALVQRVALAMQSGGVGYYPRSNFVHVDTGRLRRW
jgi:uncharacterized protein YcbK (DUF882 family)